MTYDQYVTLHTNRLCDPCETPVDVPPQTQDVVRGHLDFDHGHFAQNLLAELNLGLPVQFRFVDVLVKEDSGHERVVEKVLAAEWIGVHAQHVLIFFACWRKNMNR